VVLYHFSEEPDIRLFEPRSPIERPEVEPMVWAIDEWHQAMYFVPRDCPRACFWPGTQTTDADRERWFGGIEARMVIAVETGWLERIRETVLYRYEMPKATFVLNDETAGHYVSREAVTPLSVEPVGDLLPAMAAANVELRVTPSLVELWRRVVRSTLCFSGTRLRNAAGYDPALFVQS
jgi:Family of unknown function (DUF6886)